VERNFPAGALHREKIRRVKTMGKNVNVSFKGEKMLIEVDCSKDFGPSKSGKTIIIASTEGNSAFSTGSGKNVVVGLNVYKKS